MDIVKNLIHRVTRAYYDHKDIIVMDLLLLNDTVRDDQLAASLGVPLKDLQKVCGKLKLHGLLQVESRFEELKPGENQRKEYKEKRKVSRSYYFIDYKVAVNVIKFKIYKIGKIIEKEVQKNITHLPYKCRVCQKEFSALDMLSLPMTAEQIPMCDICNGELELDNSHDTSSSNAKYVKFMNESKPIVDLLKLTDNIVIPESSAKLPAPGTSMEELSVPQIQTKVKDSTVTTVASKIVVEIQEDVKKELPDVDEDLQKYYASLVSRSNVSTPAVTSQGDLDSEYSMSVGTKRMIDDINSESDSDEDEEFEEIV